MKYNKFGNKYVIRLEKGEEIIKQIIQLCKDEKIRLGYFHGLGAVFKIEIGLFEPKQKKYYPNVYEKPFEITSLHGSISEMKGECYIHCHGVFSDIKNQCVGGHVKGAVVGPTCEIVLVKIEGSMGRYFDKDIGLNLFKFE